MAVVLHLGLRLFRHIIHRILGMRRRKRSRCLPHDNLMQRQISQLMPRPERDVLCGGIRDQVVDALMIELPDHALHDDFLEFDKIESHSLGANLPLDGDMHLPRVTVKLLAFAVVIRQIVGGIEHEFFSDEHGTITV